MSDPQSATNPSAAPTADRRPTGLLGANLPPSPWVVRFLVGAPAGKPILDLACGAGRHARLAAAAGYDVVAVDRAPEIIAALADAPRIQPAVFDLEAGAPWPFGRASFGAVIVTNYLHRPLLADIAAAISDDGILIYETFAAGHERYRVPSCPDFLLQPNELLPPVLAANRVVVAFEQGERPTIAANGRHGGIVQRLAAVGRAHPWALVAPRSLDD